MTKRVGSGVATAIGIAALAVVARAQALPSSLGVSENQAREDLVQSVMNGYPPSLGAGVFRAAPAAVRVTLVQGVMAWAKAYTQTAAFRMAYTASRMNSKPEPPASLSAGDPIKQQRDDMDKAIAEMRKNAQGQSPEIRRAVEDAIKQMQATVDELAKNPEMVKAMRDAAAAQRTEDEQRFQQELKEFDAKHPVDPNAAVANALQRFLDVCGDVDFGARLVSQNGRMVFANPAYEMKSSDWKACFRAGREPVAAARTAAQAWLKELGR